LCRIWLRWIRILLLLLGILIVSWIWLILRICSIWITWRVRIWHWRISHWSILRISNELRVLRISNWWITNNMVLLVVSHWWLWLLRDVYIVELFFDQFLLLLLLLNSNIAIFILILLIYLLFSWCIFLYELESACFLLWLLFLLLLLWLICSYFLRDILQEILVCCGFSLWLFFSWYLFILFEKTKGCFFRRIENLRCRYHCHFR